jgi:hypothetical protein
MGAAIVPEGHRQGTEVPDDGPECQQPLNAEDQVEAAQVKREAVNGESLAADGDWGSETDAKAAHPVTVCHHHIKASARGDGETQALHER